MPLILRKNAKLGNIINSLPYFGSYGGLIVHPEFPPDKKRKIKLKLLEFFNDFALIHNVILSTIVASPFDRDQMFYFEKTKYHYIDSRVAQVAVIPRPRDTDVKDSLLSMFSSSCRRAIRKAERFGITVKEATERGDALNQFYAIYRENIELKRGLIKEKKFFEDALDKFPKGGCSLRYAELEGQVVAGIFQFYHKNIAEYFQPAIDHEHRHTDATNLLVFLGMERAVNEGYLYWNFGGTWIMQEDLYHFKRSFGALDFFYYYFIIAHADHSPLKELGPEDLAREYRWFYTIPYSELRVRQK